MREKLIDRMKAYFGEDVRRINHALTVLALAEEIRDAEGGDPLTVEAAAILHDIGIPEAFRKYGSTAGHHQEVEGPPIAEAIMASLAIDGATVKHVSDIVASHHSGNRIDTPEFRCIWDADWIVNLGAMYNDWPTEKKLHVIGKTFRTETGKRLAYARYGKKEGA